MASRPFGPALVASLEERGWSQADLRRALAERGVEVTHAAVGEWTRGSSLPSADKAALVIDLVSEGDAEVKSKLWESLATQPASDEAA